MLDQDTRTQLEQYLLLMEGDVVLSVSAGEDASSQELLSLVNELTAITPRIYVERKTLDRSPSFTVDRPGETTGIVFAGVPLGHEFTSLVLALLQVSGRPPKADAAVIERIRKLKGPLHFETFISLTCHNCPDVVQALNLMSLLNPEITHTMVDGAVFQSEAEERSVMAVPAVFLNGAFFEGGRMSLDDLLDKLGQPESDTVWTEREPYEVLVIGGGPAGVSAAIYAARKGIRTGLLAERFGGQVLDTMGIENLIGTAYTEGPKLAGSLKEHLSKYPIELMDRQRVHALERKDTFVEVTLENGGVLQSRTVVLAVGARWRNVGVPGEQELRNKGVAYCPHCDGPIYAGKDVAVIGGGNSGVEAAIDLAGICRHVTLLEFLPELRADAVLQKRLMSLPNATILKHVQTKEITGTEKVDGLVYTDRATGEEHRIDLAGIFVQIGLVPNTEWLGESIVRNRMGEIEVDSHGATSMPGVYAAGDCTNTPFKQIVIAMGSGATATLGAFDYILRN